VARGQDGYELSEDGLLCSREPVAEAVLDTLFALVHHRAFALRPDAALVRGALGADGRRRFLLIGAPRSDLSAIAVHLLFAGVAMEGDALGLLDDAGVATVPRRFHIDESARRRVPEVEPLLDGLPAIVDATGGHIWGLDPGVAGFDWEVRATAVDVVVVVEPNEGGRTRAVAVAKVQTAQRLTACCSPPPAGGHGWLRHVTALADGADCWALHVGRVDDAAIALRRVLA
jgi:hypothetical protein